MKEEDTINRLIETSERIETKIVQAQLVIEGAMGKETRAQAYQKFVEDGQNLTQEEIILKFLKSYGRHTRRQIEVSLQIRGSSVCARINSLMKKGLVVESGIVECEYTQKRVVLYSALTDVALK